MPRPRFPKRGSRGFSPRKRAKKIVARINFWPNAEEGPKLLGFAGYKAGMTHAFVIEDRERVPEFGREIRSAVTILDTPPMIICAIRAYLKTGKGLQTLTEAWTENLPPDIRLRIKSLIPTTPKIALNTISSKIDEVSEIRVIAATQPRLASVSNKKPELIEIKIDGGNKKEQFNYACSLLGEIVKIEDVFSPGETLDVIGITKGKGFQGPVKRWGIRILQHKSRKTKRGVASIGPWHPARVMSGVPRAGQVGFHQRTEYNKRVLQIGTNGEQVTPNSGFHNYGKVRGDYVLLKGSVMGPKKRLIRLRKAARTSRFPESEPRLTYLHTVQTSEIEGE